MSTVCTSFEGFDSSSTHSSYNEVEADEHQAKNEADTSSTQSSASTGVTRDFSRRPGCSSDGNYSDGFAHHSNSEWYNKESLIKFVNKSSLHIIVYTAK
jgi:hypothetical protein